MFFSLNAAEHWWYNNSLLGLCFVVGLFGGAVYVHGFRLISSGKGALSAAAMTPELIELAMPIGALAADCGICLSDIVGLVIQGCLYAVNDIPGATLPVPSCG